MPYDRAKFRRALEEQTVVPTSTSYLDDHVEVTESLRVPGQLGLFAARRFERFEPIMAYMGKRVPIKDLKRTIHADARDPSNAYLFEVEHWSRSTGLPVQKRRRRVVELIDGSDPRTSSAARYVNAAVFEDERNACFKQFENQVYLVATRVIPAGTEILASYGRATEDIIHIGG
jgi:hypothetical protein